MLESSIDEEIPTGNIDRMLEKIHHELEKHNEKYEKLGLYISSTT
jgi:hypothetical protein